MGSVRSRASRCPVALTHDSQLAAQAAIGTSDAGRAPHWLHVLSIALLATTATVSAAGAVLVLLSAARLWSTLRHAKGTSPSYNPSSTISGQGPSLSVHDLIPHRMHVPMVEQTHQRSVVSKAHMHLALRSVAHTETQRAMTMCMRSSRIGGRADVGPRFRARSMLSVTTGAATAASYVISLWLVALLVATGIWLAFIMVLQSGSAAAALVRLTSCETIALTTWCGDSLQAGCRRMTYAYLRCSATVRQGSAHGEVRHAQGGEPSADPTGACPGETCLNLRAFGFLSGAGCLCDPAALAAVALCAAGARRELVYALIGAGLGRLYSQTHVCKHGRTPPVQACSSHCKAWAPCCTFSLVRPHIQGSHGYRDLHRRGAHVPRMQRHDCHPGRRNRNPYAVQQRRPRG